jgi:two-component system response regulator PhcR
MRDQAQAHLKIDIQSLPATANGKARNWIQISDNGPGIDLTVLGNVKSRKASFSGQGSGMGLLFCRRVVESLSGEFMMQSCHEKNSPLPKGVSTRITLAFN